MEKELTIQTKGDGRVCNARGAKGSISRAKTFSWCKVPAITATAWPDYRRTLRVRYIASNRANAGAIREAIVTATSFSRVRITLARLLVRRAFRANDQAADEIARDVLQTRS